MQAVRTAGQKSLSKHLHAMTCTLVRYLYGLPFALLYWLVVGREQPSLIALLSNALSNSNFIVYAVIASVAQILATFALIKVFSTRNFAVGTSFAKTEAIQVAIFGSVLYSNHLNGMGWSAVMVGVVGTLILSNFSIGQLRDGAAALWGVTSGALFAFTSLFLRQASLALDTNPVMSAATTLLVMVFIQSSLCAIYIEWKIPDQWKKLKSHQSLSWFVGATSALGSVGWFTAMSLQNPALVKTLGQVEFFITVAITTFVFHEKIKMKEWLGMMFIVGSVVLILYA